MKSASKVGWPAKLPRRAAPRRAAGAAAQRQVDGAVSKTINLPASATVDDIRSIYLAAGERTQSRSREPCFVWMPLLRAQVR